MAKTSRKDPAAGRFAYEGLDRVIHEKARLGVLTSLMAHPKGLVFADLKRLCGLTDGNLSRHLQVLEEAGLVDILKGYDDKRPQTVCKITANGRRRFLSYLVGARTGRARRRRDREGRPCPHHQAGIRIARSTHVSFFAWELYNAKYS